MAFEISIVGEVVVRRDGAPVGRPLTGSHPRTALALLVVERPHGVPREVLADVVWPEGPPPTWDSALRTIVSRVRRFLTTALGPGDDPVVARHGRYALRLPEGTAVDIDVAGDEVDVARRALGRGDAAEARAAAESAAARVRGEFLPGIGGRWVENQRARVLDVAVSALEVASEAALAAGDPAGALAAADAAAEHAPLRESTHRCRMAAHAVAGNRAEALSVYQHLRRSLVERLGIDPSPETEAAYLAILEGAPDNGRPAPPRAVRPAARSAQTSPPGPLPFVGREHELAVLAESWGRARARNCHLVLVSGEAGIGKTRLASEAARGVTGGDGLVLFGRCDEEGLVPYQPFVEALDAYVAATSLDELPPLDEAALAELGAMLPSLAGPRRAGGPGTRAALFDATSNLIESIAADRPLLLVLDDVHWADDDTLLLVRHLLRRSARTRLLVIAVSRDDAGAPRSPWGEVLPASDSEGWLQRLPLAGLGEAEVRTLLRETLGARRRDDAVMVRRLLAETAGNPFLLGEVLRAGIRDDGWPTGGTAGADSGGEGTTPPGTVEIGAAAARHAAADEGVGMPGAGSLRGRDGRGPLVEAREHGLPIPPAVADLVSARIARLAPAAVDLLRAGAVAGVRFDLELAAATAGLDHDAALDALDGALATGLLVEETPERYRFQHDIVRRALVSQLSGARRRALHRRLADAIERRPGAPAVHAAALAHHAAAGAAAGGDRRAVRWARVAAEQAGARTAFAEAVRLYRQALGHVPDGDGGLEADVTTDLGIALARAGHPRQAEIALIDGATLARRHGRPDVLARSALHLADVATGRPQLVIEALDLVEVALAATAPGAGDAEPDRAEPDAAGTALDAGTSALLHARLLVRRHGLRGGGGRSAGDEDPSGALEALRDRLAVLDGSGHLDERATLADELATLAGLARNPRGRVVAAHERAMAAAITHDQQAFDTALRALGAVVSETGDTLGRALLAERRVAALVEAGHFDDATGAIGEASAARAALGQDPTAVARRHVPVIRWLRSPPADRIMSPDGSHGGPSSAGGADATDALALASSGEHERARIVLRELVADLRPLPGGDRRLHDLGLVAFAVAELGDPSLVAATRRLLAPHAELRCGVGYLSFVGSAAFHLGRLAALEGAWADAERHFLLALRRHAALQARPWVALTQSALADVLDARGRPSDREWISALRAEADWITDSLGLRSTGSPLAGRAPGFTTAGGTPSL